MENQKNFFEKTLNSTKIFSGNVVTLFVDSVELINGSTSTRETVTHPGGVCVISVDKEKNIFLVRQFRYPYKEEILEIPAGKLESSETPLQCAKRELLEETGIVGKNYIFLGLMYPSPGYCAEKIYIYFCEVDYQSSPNPDNDEFLCVEKVSLAKAVDMVMSNKINDAKTQVAILKTFNLLS